jgi:hypothetical protein
LKIESTVIDATGIVLLQAYKYKFSTQAGLFTPKLPIIIGRGF